MACDSADAFAASAFAPTSHGIKSSVGADWRDHAGANPLSSRPRSISASCDIRAAPTRVQRFAGSAEREMIPRADLYSGITLRSPIEAPLISREVLPETYFLLVIMAADAQAGPFLQFQASCSCGTL